MRDGTSTDLFEAAFPDRFFDVGIAEDAKRIVDQGPHHVGTIGKRQQVGDALGQRLDEFGRLLLRLRHGQLSGARMKSNVQTASGFFSSA